MQSILYRRFFILALFIGLLGLWAGQAVNASPSHGNGWDSTGTLTVLMLRP